MGLFGGTQVKTNMDEFGAECHSVDCSGDSKVLTELQIAIRSKLCFRRSKVKELRRIRTTRSAVYLYDVLNKYM